MPSLESSFSVRASAETVFAALNDVRIVAEIGSLGDVSSTTQTFSEQKVGVGARYEWEDNSSGSKGWTEIVSASKPSEISHYSEYPTFQLGSSEEWTIESNGEFTTVRIKTFVKTIDWTALWKGPIQFTEEQKDEIQSWNNDFKKYIESIEPKE